MPKHRSHNEKISNKSKLRKYLTVLLKSVKVLKNKEKLINGHRLAQMEEIRYLVIEIIIPGQKKYISG